MVITLGLGPHVMVVQNALAGMAPSIGQGPTYRELPYTVETVTSNCVKIAGSSYLADELDQFLRDLSYHLSPFCNGSTKEITEAITRLIHLLQVKFKEYQWYDSDGSCPWRFVGFVDYFDIQLGKPDHANTSSNTGHIS